MSGNCKLITHKRDKKATIKGEKYCSLRDMLPDEGKRVRFSKNFKMEGQTWSFSAHLTSDSLSIVLYCDNIHATENYKVLVCIRGVSGEDIAISNAEATPSGLFIVPELISRQKLDSIVQSNELCFFFVEVEPKDLEKERKEKVLKGKYQMDYKELLLSGAQSDLTIYVKDSKFTCHTLILGARSSVFKSMMQHEMQEKRSGQLTLSDVDPAIFREFLFYLYTGNEEDLNWENVIELCKLAHKYCVEDLKYVCVKRTKTSISTENFFEIFLLSQQHGDSELSEATIAFFLKKSDDIIESDKWIEFMKEYPKETCVLVDALAQSYGQSL